MAEATILAALAAAVFDAALAAGVDPVAMAGGSGLDRPALADPDDRIPVAQYLRLWQVISERPVGLALGARLGLHGMGVVGYAMRHQGTVGAAFAWQQRFAAVVHPDVLPRLERRPAATGDLVVFVHEPPPPFLALREPVEAYAAAVVSGLTALAGRPVPVAGVTLPLAPPADARRYEAHFGCGVAWHGTRVEVAVDAAVLAWPLPASDPHLSTYLARRAAHLLAALPAGATFADRVRHDVSAVLAQGEPHLADVARRLAVSVRTLQRRLAMEGTGFADVVDQARRARALMLLGDPTLSCSEVGFLVGYAESAPFFRAFRRWTGLTPREYRRRRPAGDGGASHTAAS